MTPRCDSPDIYDKVISARGQKRRFRDPDTIKESHTFTATDEQFELIKRACKKYGACMGDAFYVWAKKYLKEIGE